MMHVKVIRVRNEEKFILVLLIDNKYYGEIAIDLNTREVMRKEYAIVRHGNGTPEDLIQWGLKLPEFTKQICERKDADDCIRNPCTLYFLANKK